MTQNNTTKYAFGGVDVNVAVVKPAPHYEGFFSPIIHGFLSLLNGMRITWSYFKSSKNVVTRQYPENRETLKIPERAGCELKFKIEDGYHNCPGCKICEKECPNGTIQIENIKKGVSGKMELKQFVWRMDTCTFCYACVNSCPYDAIEFVNNFEASVYDRRTLAFNLNHYVGPPAKFLKSVEDEVERAKMVVPFGRYTNTAMDGRIFDGLAPLGMEGAEKYDIRRKEEVVENV